MPYIYECQSCGVRSDMSTLRSGARAAQAEHRERAHGGLVPAAGDGISHTVRSPKGLLITVGVLLALVALKGCTGVTPEDIARHVGLL
jgi:hypothetical protein